MDAHKGLSDPQRNPFPGEKDGPVESREFLEWAEMIYCPFPTKGRGEESNASRSRGRCKPSLWGILFMCYPHPNPTKTPGEGKNPRAKGDLGHPHLTIRQSSSKNEQNPGGETPGEEELWHVLPVQGQLWVLVKCCLFELSGTWQS